MFSWVLGLKASLVFLRPTSLLYFLKIPVLIFTLSFRLGANFAFIKTVASMKVFSRVFARQFRLLCTHHQKQSAVSDAAEPLHIYFALVAPIHAHIRTEGNRNTLIHPLPPTPIPS